MENNNNEENCRKELFKLKRELKISKLLLKKKNEELNEEKEKNDKLKNEQKAIFDEFNKLSKEIEEFKEKNALIEENNNLKNLELEELVGK